MIFFRFLIGIILFTSLPLAAEQAYELGAEWLYWRPSISSECCDKWKNGVRVSLAFPEFHDNWDLIATYSYIGGDKSSKAVRFSIETIKKAQLDYHEWEVLLGYDILRNECYYVKTLVGPAGIAVNNFVKGKDRMYTLKWKEDFCGAGLRLGVDSGYRLSENLELYVTGSGSILAGSKSKIVNGWHIGTGFLYETSLLNHDAMLKIGYEFVQWENLPLNGEEEYKGPHHFEYTDKDSLGFHGIVAGLGVAF